MAKKLTETQKALIRLIGRSEKLKSGWRVVSDMLWPGVYTVGSTIPELVQLDRENKRIRLTRTGETVLEYME